jgi:tRNA threonylcarbamoyladenosine biosynthesis protein TsaE
VDETRALGRTLLRELPPGALVLLDGDLGSGKTVLTQGIAEGLGIDAAEVQSPTFTLVREHSGSGGRLIHIDLYRLTPDELPSLGLDDWLGEPDAVKVVEWADRLPPGLEADLRLKLRRPGTEGRREIREIAPGQ